MKVKCVDRELGSGHFSIGAVYEVEKDRFGYYVVCSEGDKLYFDLITKKCSWFNNDLDEAYYTFEEVKEQPYATSPEVLAQVLRKMAANVENGLRPKEGIQMAWYKNFQDIQNDSLDLAPSILYRVKPETITLKNGVEVPKPLDVVEIPQLERTTKLFIPAAYDKGYTWAYVTPLCERVMGCPTGSLFYATKEEAIQASVALFGLDIKE